MTDLTLSVERLIRAPRTQVFDAWLNPETLAKFMLPGEGMSVPRAKSDAKEGGRFEIVMAGEENEIPHAGTYHEISPHDRIVFGWESPFSTDGSTVTLEFDQAEGGTLVKLTHVRFLDEEMRDNHQAGWARILGVLDEVVGAEAAA